MDDDLGDAYFHANYAHFTLRDYKEMIECIEECQSEYGHSRMRTELIRKLEIHTKQIEKYAQR